MIISPNLKGKVALVREAETVDVAPPAADLDRILSTTGATPSPSPASLPLVGAPDLSPPVGPRCSSCRAAAS